jgi:hypothetical protein
MNNATKAGKVAEKSSSPACQEPVPMPIPALKMTLVSDASQ